MQAEAAAPAGADMQAEAVADMWVEVVAGVRVEDWAVAVRRPVLTAPLWRIMAPRMWAPCMPPMRPPANMPRSILSRQADLAPERNASSACVASPRPEEVIPLFLVVNGTSGNATVPQSPQSAARGTLRIS
jgi:hypothetical protein